MSQFIGALAFPGHPELIEQAKIGVVMGSLVSALGGYIILRIAPLRNSNRASDMVISGAVSTENNPSG